MTVAVGTSAGDQFIGTATQKLKHCLVQTLHFPFFAKLAIDLCADLDRAGGRNVERLVNTPLILDSNKRLPDLGGQGDKT